MLSGFRWALVGVGASVVLLGGAVFGLSQWAGSEDFRARAQQEASRALGVPVQLGRIEVALWPALGVGVRDVRIQTQPPLTLERIEATPVWTSLVSGTPVLDALVVRKAVLPQQALAAIAAAMEKKDKAAGAPKPAQPARDVTALLPRRIVLDRVTWVDAKAQKLTVDAEVAFAGEPLPQSARIDVVEGRYAGAKARLDRGGDAWNLRADVGGGSITGPLRLSSQRSGGWRLTGDLATDKVEVAALTAPSRTMTGKLEARTSLQADFKDPAALADALRSQTRFTVRQAVVHGIDLAQAVTSLGTSRGGKTALDTLTGNVATQGRVVQLSNLVASSGLLSATGNVNLSAERALNGRVTVVVGSVAGVPLQVGGTLDAPSATPVGVALPAAGSVGESIGKGLRGLFGK
jgi:hypothetical protein